MATQQPNDGEIEGALRYGNDEAPWMTFVPEQPPSHWGKILTDRTESAAYRRFRERAKKQHDKPSGDRHER